jgi:hypothetical protein
MNTTITLLSFGHIASRNRKHNPLVIEGELLKIPPTFIIDGVSYWPPEAEAAVDDAIRRRQAERILGRPIPPEGKDNA